ncbi:hypothetical protein [Muribaculum intestinale]|uniref:hypothetical protein n=1 Tax=Muribaculum intestinale TaxID=1796646 RepID=UPI003F6686AE
MASSPLEHLTELMRDPSLPVSVEWVDEMARLYPYMTLRPNFSSNARATPSTNLPDGA